MKISALFVDKKACIDGAWVKWIQGTRLKIARLNNPKHVELIKQLYIPHKNALNNGGELSNEAYEEIAIKCLAQTILVDWEGIADDDGKVIPFSPEKAQEILSQVPDMVEFVTSMAASVNNFRISSLENAAKN